MLLKRIQQVALEAERTKCHDMELERGELERVRENMESENHGLTLINQELGLEAKELTKKTEKGITEMDDKRALLEHVHSAVQEIRDVTQEAEKERLDISEAVERHAREIDKLTALRQKKVEQKREILENVDTTKSELASVKSELANVKSELASAKTELESAKEENQKIYWELHVEECIHNIK